MENKKRMSKGEIIISLVWLFNLFIIGWVWLGTALITGLGYKNNSPITVVTGGFFFVGSSILLSTTINIVTNFLK